MDLPILLCIETSGPTCSVALFDGEKMVCLFEEKEQNKHAEKLAVFCQQALELNLTPNYIVVSMGPGSYTGLRIGVSTAKGICFATGAKLIGVSTPVALTNGYVKSYKTEPNTLLCPMIDARRLEVYTATYDSDGNEIMPIRAEILDEHFLSQFGEKRKVAFFGTGAFKIESFSVDTDNYSIEKGLDYSSKWLLEPALEKIKCQVFEDLAYFEPYYLKDFMMTFPKAKV